MDVKTFEEYLEKMGYSWDDFDRTYEMENLIEQYADEKVKQALTIHAVVRQSEQLPSCDKCGYYIHPENKTCLREGCENY